MNIAEVRVSDEVASHTSSQDRELADWLLTLSRTMGGERLTEELCSHLPGEDITENPEDDESSDDEMDEDLAAEASAGPPTITLSQARKMSREILNFVLENSATSHGGSAKAYDLVTLLERMTVSTGHVQRDIRDMFQRM